MINELKLVLDMVGDLSGIALWVIIGFLLYKAVLYLSTAGAVVYIAKLSIVKLHDVLTCPKVETKTLWEHDGGYWPEDSKRLVEGVLNDVFSNDVHHSIEARELKKAWDEYKEKRQ